MFAESAEKAVGLTRFLGRSLPPSRISFVLIIIAAFFAGALTGVLGGAMTLNAMSYGSIRAVFLIAVPALLGAVSCITLRRRIKYKQILFLSLLSTLLYGIFYLLYYGGVLSEAGISPEMAFNILLMGNAVIFALWFITARIVFYLRYTAFFFALITPTLTIMFLLVDRSLSPAGAPESIAVMTKLYFASFIFLAAIYALFWMINAPMKRNFGVSMTDAASFFLAQWFEQSPKLEKMFEEVGEEIDTLVGVMAFRAKGTGSPTATGPLAQSASWRMKAVFVVPHIHFGPFGSLGGSEFPELISAEVAKRTGALAFVFHGCATHDFNPASSAELEKFNEKIFRALAEMKFAKAKGSLMMGKSGTGRSGGVIVNNAYFAPLTRAPRTTEDIDFSIGLAIRNYALAKGASEALIADAHNAETGEIMRVESGNRIAFEYMRAVGDALEKRGAEKKIRLGVASDPLPEFGLASGVGKAGLRVAVFEAGGRKYAVVLIDANGATPAFRREVIDAVCGTGIDDCELMTTDTHSVNRVGGVLNPVGGPRTDRALMLRKVVATAKRATADLEEVEAGAALDMVEKVTVFGVAQSSELIGTVNSIVAVVRIVAPLLLLGAVALALWMMTKV